VIFDLDGTLLDSLADIANAGNTVLQAHGYPTHTTDAYRWFVGDGVRRLLDRILPASCREDPARLEAFIREFVAEYEQSWNVASRLYEGVPELLDALLARHVRLAVLSNKPQAATDRCVTHYLGRYPFAAVLGQQPDRPPKPDLGGVREILAQLAVPPAACCYVGDTGVDMQTARGAGLYAVGATWGFRDAAELRAAGADVLIAHPRQLLELFAPG
jgi:phosphoglycolate phosphatase